MAVGAISLYLFYHPWRNLVEARRSSHFFLRSIHSKTPETLVDIAVVRNPRSGMHVGAKTGSVAARCSRTRMYVFAFLREWNCALCMCISASSDMDTPLHGTWNFLRLGAGSIETARREIHPVDQRPSLRVTSCVERKPLHSLLIVTMPFTLPRPVNTRNTWRTTDET